MRCRLSRDGVRSSGLGKIYGKATVDGTSFAAPYVAALLAEHMSLNKNVDARTAWEEIAAVGVAPLPECGSPPLTQAPDGVAVALVSLSSTVTATTPGSGSPSVLKPST